MTEHAKSEILVSGLVVSDKMDKSIVVLVVRRVQHKLYKKYIMRSVKLHAHDEDNRCQAGDKVTLRSTRPVSKTKSWVLHRIDEKAQ